MAHARPALLVALLAAGGTCEDDAPRSSEAPAAAARAAEEAVAPEPAAVAADPAPEPPDVDVGGLTLRRLDDGRIEMRGTDRWGGSVETTYESAEYLRNALPVLERSLSPEQSAAIRAYLEPPR